MIITIKSILCIYLNIKTSIIQIKLISVLALSSGEDNFVQCPESVLKWVNRKNHLLEETLRHEVDIICLQEVDQFAYFNRILAQVGYSGLFFPKPSSPCLDVYGNTGPDGCAMFYRNDKLKLISSENLILEADGRETNQVAIISHFEPVDKVILNTPHFCVAVTHLKSTKGYEELRHKQGNHFLKYLSENVSSFPLIVCGDFNATPDEPVYIAFSTHGLNLASSYMKLSPEGKEAPYTTWKIRGTPSDSREICRTIDYIWHTKDKLQVSRLLSIPTEEQIGKSKLPNASYPSDHISLVTDFTFVNNS